MASANWNSDALRALLLEDAVDVEWGEPCMGAAPAGFTQLLLDCGADAGLLASWDQACVVNGAFDIHMNTLHPAEWLLEQRALPDGEQELPVRELLQAGLVPIGFTYGGDPIVVDVRDEVGSVGFIDHASQWSAATGQLRRHYAKASSSLYQLVNDWLHGEPHWCYHDVLVGTRRRATAE